MFLAGIVLTTNIVFDSNTHFCASDIVRSSLSFAPENLDCGMQKAGEQCLTPAGARLHRVSKQQLAKQEIKAL